VRHGRLDGLAIALAHDTLANIALALPLPHLARPLTLSQKELAAQGRP
jgi:hypothetical protein